MLKTEFKLEYKIEESPTDGGVPVIVVAAGSSTRMNGINKQTALLCGVPLIIRTLMRFERCGKISNIILVVKPDDVFSMQQLADRYHIGKLSRYCVRRGEPSAIGKKRLGARTRKCRNRAYPRRRAAVCDG